ncbi:MAG TPA: transcriptional regulator [Lactobacillus sp.]|nr:transcriptional regulator [Lactobacillus sp.]
MQNLKEIQAYFKGEPNDVEVHTVTIELPERFDAKAVKQLRKNLNVTQKTMAHLLGISPRTVESWEIGRAEPNGSSRRLLELFQKDPKIIELLKD